MNITRRSHREDVIFLLALLDAIVPGLIPTTNIKGIVRMAGKAREPQLWWQQPSITPTATKPRRS